jgi:non-specific serine/threonine protein kinase
MAEIVARIVGSLWSFWYRRGYFKEGRRWLEKALAISDTCRALVRVKVLAGAGAMAYCQADFTSATARLTECISLQRVLEDQKGLANALNIMGAVAMAQRRNGDARVFFKESLELFDAVGDERSTIMPLNNLANIEYDDGHYAVAIGLHEKILALSRKYGDDDSSALSLTNLGWAALLQGDDKSADGYCREALTLFNQLGNRGAITFCLEGLAGVAGAQCQPVRAARLFGSADALREAVSFPLTPDNLAYHQRFVSIAQSQIDGALFRKSLDEGRAMSFEQAVAYALSVGH